MFSRPKNILCELVSESNPVENMQDLISAVHGHLSPGQRINILSTLEVYFHVTPIHRLFFYLFLQWKFM